MVKRGDIVIAVFSGEYGKPRPAVVVQTDLANPTHSSLMCCPITSHLVDAPLFRLEITPSLENSLEKACQVMVDKITTIRRDKVRRVIGRLDEDTIIRLNRSMAFWLGLG